MSETTTDSGLIYEDIKVGDGTLCTGRGQTAIVHYTGWLEDGTKFDSSKDREQTIQFSGCVRLRHSAAGTRAWSGMQVGGVRKLTVPPQLGYGEQGRGRCDPAQCNAQFRDRAAGNFRVNAARGAGSPDRTRCAAGAGRGSRQR